MIWNFNVTAERLDDGRYRVVATGTETGRRIERVGYHPLWELIRIIGSLRKLNEERTATDGEPTDI